MLLTFVSLALTTRPFREAEKTYKYGGGDFNFSLKHQRG